MKKIKRKSRASKTENVVQDIIKMGKGRFNFSNGDTYEGQYMVINKKEIYRHGYGIYKTSDGDEYEAMWEKDNIISNFHAIYGNKAEYKGEIDNEGAFSGKGTYIFPDGTSLTATWKNNNPHSDFIYVDPLGYRWHGRLTTNNQEVTFSPENRIWA